MGVAVRAVGEALRGNRQDRRAGNPHEHGLKATTGFEPVYEALQASA
jgi:hypothetical protein